MTFKAIRHYIFTALALVSVLLLLVVVIAWPLSYWWADGWYFPVAPQQLVIYSVGGRFDVSWSDMGGTEPRLHWHREPTPPNLNQRQPNADFQALGFLFNHDYYTSPSQRLIDLRFPYWFIALLTAVLPAWWLRTRFREPLPEVACPKCGYDLRVNPDDCPECGWHQA